tara:strand:- start:5433 stop:5642 length:210 start_codon:yes stop_codon:yes gene_type:complete
VPPVPCIKVKLHQNAIWLLGSAQAAEVFMLAANGPERRMVDRLERSVATRELAEYDASNRPKSQISDHA